MENGSDDDADADGMGLNGYGLSDRGAGTMSTTGTQGRGHAHHHAQAQHAQALVGSHLKQEALDSVSGGTDPKGLFGEGLYGGVAGGVGVTGSAASGTAAAAAAAAVGPTNDVVLSSTGSLSPQFTHAQSVRGSPARGAMSPADGRSRCVAALSPAGRPQTAPRACAVVADDFFARHGS